jgi:hypothetical protein
MAAYVQDTGIVRVASGGSTSTATFASATTLGNTIIASGGVFSSVGFLLSYSDKIGGSATTNSWNARRSTSYGSGEAIGFIVDSLSLAQAGSSHEVDVTSDQSSGNYYTWAAAEFSGITSYDSTASAETSSVGGNISSYAVTSGTFGTNPFVFAALSIDSANNHNPGSNNLGGTQLYSELDATTWMAAAGAYAQKVGTGGTQTVTWSFTFGTTIAQWAGLAVYNTSAAAPTIAQQPASATINDGEYWYGWVLSNKPEHRHVPMAAEHRQRMEQRGWSDDGLLHRRYAPPRGGFWHPVPLQRHQRRRNDGQQRSDDHGTDAPGCHARRLRPEHATTRVVVNGE